MPKPHINAVLSDLFFNHLHHNLADALETAEDERRALLVDAREFITDYAPIIPLLQDVDVPEYANALVDDYLERI